MVFVVKAEGFELTFKTLLGALAAARACLDNGDAVTITPQMKGKK